jgi:phosphoribulokinase
MAIAVYGKINDEKNSSIFQHVEHILQKYDIGKPLLLGVAGAGGAGKTTFERNLCHFIRPAHAIAIDLDDYLFPREYRAKLEVTGYNPVANKIDLAHQNIEDLKQGKDIVKPCYDHRTGKLLPDETVQPTKVIIVEGVTTLYPELRELPDCSFFLDAPDETQIKSRITRDVKERGYTLEEALALFTAVQPDYKRFVEPTKAFADVVCHVSTDYVMTITNLSDRVR